jgi:hypothetical protein
MPDEEVFASPIEIPTLTGELSVGPSNDGRFALFKFTTPTGPVRLAVRNEDLPRLIATAAHAYSPELPSKGGSAPRRALPVSGWNIMQATGDAVAVSFEMGAGAALTFMVPGAQTRDMIDALQALPGAAAPPARPSGTSLN